MKSHDDAFALLCAAQVKAFGEATIATRVKPAAQAEVAKQLASLPLSSSQHQIAARFDEIERESPNWFVSEAQRDEEIHKASLAKKSGAVFGIPHRDLKEFTASQLLELANSEGKTVPTWYLLKKKGGR